MSNECIFCKIINGEIPSTKIYEDEYIFAFMDINPLAKGHALVIPKKHFNQITSVPDDLLQKIIIAVKKIAVAQIKSLNATGINITQANGTGAGQEVPHIHFHVIPRHNEKPEDANWKPIKYESFKEMNKTAELITEAL